MKRILTIITASVLLTIGITVASTRPVAAAENIKVCNSSASDETIQTWDRYQDNSHNVYEGDCVTQFDLFDNVRVNTSIHLNTHSYKIGIIGEGYGPCHDNSQNVASNPNGNNAPDGVRYRVYHSYHCD